MNKSAFGDRVVPGPRKVKPLRNRAYATGWWCSGSVSDSAKAVITIAIRLRYEYDTTIPRRIRLRRK